MFAVRKRFSGWFLHDLFWDVNFNAVNSYRYLLSNGLQSIPNDWVMAKSIMGFSHGKINDNHCLRRGVGCVLWLAHYNWQHWLYTERLELEIDCIHLIWFRKVTWFKGSDIFMYISNTRDPVSPHFQTQRRELKIRRTTECFWRTLRCS